MAFESVSAVQSRTGFPSSPQTFAFDAGTNPDRCVILVVWGYSSIDYSDIAATYGGAAMTASTETVWGAAREKMRAFVLTGAASGSNNFSISWTGSFSGFNAVAVCYSGVSSAGAFTAVADSTSDTVADATISSATGETGVYVFATRNASATLSPNSTETERLDTTTSVQAGFGSIGVYEKPGATSLTIRADASAGIFDIGFAISLAPASGGSTIAAISNYHRMMRRA